MSAWTGADAVRVARQVGRLHALGPRPLLEFLTEIAGDELVRADIETNLGRYARLDPGIVALLDGRRLKLPIVVVDGDVVVEVDPNSAQPVRGAA